MYIHTLCSSMKKHWGDEWEASKNGYLQGLEEEWGWLGNKRKWNFSVYIFVYRFGLVGLSLVLKYVSLME